MFLDEARLASRIRDPHVVPTIDVVAREGELFLAMEYVEGEKPRADAPGVREEGGLASRRPSWRGWFTTRCSVWRRRTERRAIAESR